MSERTAAICCGACDEVVSRESVLRDMRLTSTADQRRMWISQVTGEVVHLCDREARRKVFERDGLACSLPPWQQRVNRLAGAVAHRIFRHAEPYNFHPYGRDQKFATYITFR